MPRTQGTRLNKAYKGERVHTAKLTEDDVRLIDMLLAEGLSLGKIADKFDVSRNAIWDIQRGYSWKHITGVGQ